MKNSNPKTRKNFDAQVDADNAADAKVLVEQLADVIMQNRRLAAEIALRWAKQNGYYFTDAAESDADFARKYPGSVSTETLPAPRRLTRSTIKAASHVARA